jgi:hypothetical protein
MSGATNEFANLRGRSVMILTPVYREASWHYTRSLLASVLAFERLGIRFGVKQVVGNANLGRARNELVAAYLASGAGDALFIDADMEWQPSDVLRLLSSAQPFIGAPCRRRIEMPESDPRSWCVQWLPEGVQKLNQDAAGAIEVGGVGTGFLKVQRRVFESLITAHPDWKRPATGLIPPMPPEERDWYYRFFRFPENDDAGEDYFFCRAWRELGGSIWIEPQVSVGHVGEYVYRGSIWSLFRRAPAP